MPVEFGLLRPTTDHAIAITTKDDGVYTRSKLLDGRRVSAAWELIVVPAPAALPSTAKLRCGIALDADDCIYATQTAPTTPKYSFGVCTRADGAVFMSSSPTGAFREVYHPLLGFVLVDQRGAVYISAFAGIALSDAGSGLVDTTIFGAGAAAFVRATVKWTKLSTGLWAQIASGAAASCYTGADTAVGSYGGYFAEPAGIQLVTPDASIRDMTDASWVKGATITVAKTGTGIDGVVNSCTRLTFGAVEATNTILQTLTAAASSRTYSPWIRVIGTLSGTVSITQDGGSTWTDVTSQLTAANFVRVSLTASVLNASFGIKGSGNGDVVFVDFNQFEAGANATSPMATAGAARNADVLTYAFAGNASASAGTCYAEQFLMWGTDAAINRGIILFDTTIANAAFQAQAGFAPTSARMRDGTNIVDKSGLASLTTGVRKRASSWGASGMAITGDGLPPATGSFDGDIGSAAIGIGCGTGGASQMNGTIKNVKIWTYQRNDLPVITG